MANYYSMHLSAAVFPVTAGLLLYGGMAAAVIGAVVISSWLSLLVWRRIGGRGRQLNGPRILWMSMLLSLTLPPDLLEGKAWPIAPAAGILLVILAWVLSPIGSGRVHPVLAAFIVLTMLFHPLLAPHRVLTMDHLLIGNLLNTRTLDSNLPRTQAWVFQRGLSPADGTDALFEKEPATDRLGDYTSARLQPDRFSVSAQMVIRDQLPPLEDFLIGGEPGPIGASSGVAVIIGGLFLLYRGLIDWRIPLLTVIAALAAFLILPLPVVISDLGTQWRWLAFRPHYLGWEAGLTLSNYELLASPLLFVAFFLATSPQAQPMSRAGRAVYGMIFGLLCGPMQLYGSVSVGPFVALLLASLASPCLDRMFTPGRRHACPA
jgi:Na+-transporting NADH:ubiquinone oxidoreductase subunit NqrB